MSKISVSVIIPVYNVEEYIQECLESVLEQTLTDIEVVCVDDCSTDGSVDAILSIDDDRVTLVRREQNGGLPAARNSGLRVAQGEFFYFLDADDVLYDETSLEGMLGKAKEFQADIVIGGTVKYYDTSNLCFLGNHKVYLQDSRVVRCVDEYPAVLQSVIACNKLVRREFVEQNDIVFFNEKCRRFEDNAYTPKLLYSSACTYIWAQPTYLFRQPQGGEYFRTKIFPNLLYQREAIEEMFHFFDDRPQFERARHFLERGYGFTLVMGAVLVPREGIDTEWLYTMLKETGEVLACVPSRSYEHLNPLVREALPYIRQGRYEDAWDVLKKNTTLRSQMLSQESDVFPVPCRSLRFAKDKEQEEKGLIVPEGLFPMAKIAVAESSSSEITVPSTSGATEQKYKELVWQNQVHAAKLDVLYSSWSWRVTAPLRKMLRFVRGY